MRLALADLEQAFLCDDCDVSKKHIMIEAMPLLYLAARTDGIEVVDALIASRHSPRVCAFIVQNWLPRESLAALKIVIEQLQHEIETDPRIAHCMPLLKIWCARETMLTMAGAATKVGKVSHE